MRKRATMHALIRSRTNTEILRFVVGDYYGGSHSAKGLVRYRMDAAKQPVNEWHWLTVEQ